MLRAYEPGCVPGPEPRRTSCVGAQLGRGLPQRRPRRAGLVSNATTGVSTVLRSLRFAARPSPLHPPEAVAVRIPAQRYTEPADYGRLAVALAGRLGR